MNNRKHVNKNLNKTKQRRTQHNITISALRSQIAKRKQFIVIERTWNALQHTTSIMQTAAVYIYISSLCCQHAHIHILIFINTRAHTHTYTQRISSNVHLVSLCGCVCASIKYMNFVCTAATFFFNVLLLWIICSAYTWYIYFHGARANTNYMQLWKKMQWSKNYVEIKCPIVH